MAKSTPAKRVKQFPDCGLKVSKDSLFCTFCSEILDFTKKSSIQNHLKSQTHRKAQAHGKQQPQLDTVVHQLGEKKEVWSSMASTFVSCGIPLHVFRNERFRDWMKKNVLNGESLPSETTLRRCLKEEGQKDLMLTKKICKDKDVLIMIDETQDLRNRKTMNILICPAEPNSKFRILNVEQMEKCDAPTVIQFMLRSLSLIEVPITKVLALISDNAAYMKCAGKTLLLMNPRSIHSSCWAHVLHLVSEDIRESLGVADKFIAKVKASLVKANSRRNNLLNVLEAHGKPRKLPPVPVLTRWTTWLETGNFHYQNLAILRDWISQEKADSKAIEKLKELVLKPELEKELETTCLAFPSLSSTIKTLEQNNLASSDVLQLIEIIRGILELSPALEEGLEKLDSYLNDKHPCIQFWRDVQFLDPRKRYKFAPEIMIPASLMNLGTTVEIPLAELVLYKSVCAGYVSDSNFCPFRFWNLQSREMPNLSQLALKILCIPGTSAEVERSFSALNRTLTPLRSSLTEENLNIHLRLTFNNRSDTRIEDSEETTASEDED